MNGFVILALAAVVAAGAYAISLARKPWVNCKACDGGKDRGLLFRYAYSECPVCGGAGRRPRAGVRVLQGARARALRWGTERSSRRLP